MYPLLTTLEWHGVSRPIGSYGVMLALALAVGAVLAVRSGVRAGLDVGALIASLAAAVGAGFVGACALSVAVLWMQHGSLGAALGRPGIVFYGGFLSGGAGLLASARWFGLPPWATLDVMLPALPIAHALGRLGCFLGGCCYGAVSHTPWAVHYGSHGSVASGPARHPWPLYEALALLLLAAWFWSPRRSAGFAGRRAASYVVAYAVLRLALEPLRGDTARGVLFGGWISTSQVISLALLLGVCGSWCYSARVPTTQRCRT